MGMTEYLDSEMKRNDEDLLREITKLVGCLNAAAEAVELGQGTFKTDTDWLASSAAKVERMVEKRTLLGTLTVVDEKSERSVTAIVAERLAAKRGDAAEATDYKRVEALIAQGWTSEAAFNHVEGTCDIAVCQHEAHRSDPDFDTEKSEEEPCRVGTPGCSSKHRRTFESCETY